MFDWTTNLALPLAGAEYSHLANLTCSVLDPIRYAGYRDPYPLAAFYIPYFMLCHYPKIYSSDSDTSTPSFYPPIIFSQMLHPHPLRPYLPPLASDRLQTPAHFVYLPGKSHTVVLALCNVASR